MSEKHTPGPWQWIVDRWNGGYSALAASNGGDVLRPLHKNDGDSGAAWFEGDESLREANARLIAAAPDLLDACKDALALLEDVDAADGCIGDALRAAIARATGDEA